MLKDRIKAARKYAKLSQQALGEKCVPQISKNAVSLWETEDPRKRTTPKLENLITIASVTGVNLEWLTTGRGEMVPSQTEKKARITEYAKPRMTEITETTPEEIADAGLRFRMALDATGTRPVDIAKAFDVEPQQVNNWKKRGVSKEKNNSVARFLGIEPGWLATGVGEMLSTNPHQHKNHDQLGADKHNGEHGDSPHETIRRLESLFPDKGWKYKSDFYQSYGIGSQVYNNWRKRGIPWRHIFEVSRFMNVSPEWLVTGRGKKVVNNAVSPYAAELPNDIHAMLMLALGRGSEARIPDDIKPLVQKMLSAITELIRREQAKWL